MSMSNRGGDKKIEETKSSASPKPGGVEYDLYLLLETPMLNTTPPSNNAVVLCPLPTTSSSSKPSYNAYFVMNGKWVTEKEKIKETRIGSYELDLQNSLQKEGILEKTKKNSTIITVAFAKAKIFNNSSMLLSMPDEILWEFYHGVRLPDKSNLTATSTTTVGLFQNQLTADRLVDAVFKGDADEAGKILKVNADALFKKGNGEDYYGNTIKDISPYAAALRFDDLDMLEVMQPAIEKNIPEAVRQFCEIFPQDRHDFEPGKKETKKEMPEVKMNELKESKERKNEEKTAEEKFLEKNFPEFAELVAAITADPFETTCPLLLMPSLPKEGERLPAQLTEAFVRSGNQIVYINHETKQYLQKTLDPAEAKNMDKRLEAIEQGAVLSQDSIGDIGNRSYTTGSSFTREGVSGFSLTHEGISANTARALQAFQDRFTPQDTLKHGKVLNYIVELFMQALRIYERQVMQALWPDRRQSLFFTQNVIGFLERHFPTNYAQYMHTGVPALDNGDKLIRKLEMDEVGEPFFTEELGSTAYFCILNDQWVNGGDFPGSLLEHGLTVLGDELAYFTKLCDRKTAHRDQFKNWLLQQHLELKQDNNLRDPSP